MYSIIHSLLLNKRCLATIAPGVDYSHIAREWRCKWDPSNDKASLVDVNEAFAKILPQVKALTGVVSVQRVVCGGCHDFKVVMKINADNYKAWAMDGHKPETGFLEAIRKIKGISAVETQTYTLETL